MMTSLWCWQFQVDERDFSHPVVLFASFACLDLNRVTVMPTKSACLWVLGQNAEVPIVPGCLNAIPRGSQLTLVDCFSSAFYADLFFICGFPVEILRILIDFPTIELLLPMAVPCHVHPQHLP